MCLEDIRIMRQSSGVITAKTAPATAGEIIAASPDRIGIIFCPNSAANYWVSTDQNVAVGTGIPVPANGAPVMIDVFKWGDFCRRPWFAIGVGGAVACAVGELFIPDSLTRQTGYGKPS